MRIFPGYWVALAIGAATVGLVAMRDPFDAIQVVTLTQTFGTDTPFEGLSPAWSLSLFLTFYLLVFAWARGRARSRSDARGDAALLRGEVWALAAVIGLSALVRLTSVTDPFAPDPVFTVLGRADWFAAGMLLGVVVVAVERGMGGRRLTLLGRHPGWSCLAAAAATVGGALLPLHLEELRDQIDTVAAALLVACAVLHGPQLRGPQRLLASRPGRALGRWSFGIFLWGYIAQKAVLELWPAVPTSAHVALAVPAGVILGAASWRWVERPSVERWGRSRTGAPRRDEASPEGDIAFAR